MKLIEIGIDLYHIMPARTKLIRQIQRLIKARGWSAAKHGELPTFEAMRESSDLMQTLRYLKNQSITVR